MTTPKKSDAAYVRTDPVCNCRSVPLAPRTSAPTPLTEPSIRPASIPFHNAARRQPLHRLDDRRVVDLVDVVLVQQQPVDAAEAARQPFGDFRPASPRRTSRAGTRRPRRRPRPPSAFARSGSHRRHGRPRRARASRRLAAARRVRLQPHRRRPDRAPRSSARGRIDLVVAAERVRHADEAGDGRTDRQEDERNRHRHRRLVRRPMVALRLAQGRAVRVGAVTMAVLPAMSRHDRRRRTARCHGRS